jgi:hypothetical protein
VLLEERTSRHASAVAGAFSAQTRCWKGTVPDNQLFCADSRHRATGVSGLLLQKVRAAALTDFTALAWFLGMAIKSPVDRPLHSVCERLPLRLNGGVLR